MIPDQSPYSAPHHIDPLPRGDWPFWVMMGLWKVPSRWAAFGYMWLCIIASIASIAAGFIVHPQYFIGALLILAALWYWLAIRWVDGHASWG